MALRNVKAGHRYSKSGGMPIQKGEMMAVLVEGLSIVVRNEALERKFQGGSARFQDGLSNESICFDNELTCVHLRSPDEVGGFIGWCESMGLTFALGGECVDIVVIDQRKGPTLKCNWIAHSVLEVDDDESKCMARVCWFSSDSHPGFGTRVPALQFEIAMPFGWRVSRSLSASHVFLPKHE